MTKVNKHKGSNFEDFLVEENIKEDVDAAAIKRVIAYELEKNMKKNNITKTQLATEMKTSRSAIERLLDPYNTSITLNTLLKAAHIIGKKVKLSLI